MDNIYNAITNLIVFIPVILIFSILPFITRKDIMFGVTIPSSEWKNDYFTSLRKKFVIWAVLIGAAFLALNFALALMLPVNLSVVFMQIIIWSAVIAYFLLYIFFWVKTKKYKESAGWQVTSQNIAVADTSTSYEKRALSLWWYAVYVLLIGVTFFYALRLYDAAPNSIPVRFDMQGAPISYQVKSMSLVYEIIGMQGFMALLFFGINYIIKRAKKTIDPNNPKQSSAQNEKMKHRWSIFLFITGLLMLLIFSFVMYSMFITLPMWLMMYTPLALTGVIIVYAVVLSIKTGQSGSKIKIKGEQVAGKSITRDDDSLWKLGMFYFNKEDPAVFVEKRFGAGWTNNWAKWQSWLVLAGIIALIVLSFVLST